MPKQQYVWLVYPDDHASPPDVWGSEDDAYQACAYTIEDGMEEEDKSAMPPGYKAVVDWWNSSYEPKWIVRKTRVMTFDE